MGHICLRQVWGDGDRMQQRITNMVVPKPGTWRDRHPEGQVRQRKGMGTGRDGLAQVLCIERGLRGMVSGLKVVTEGWGAAQF